MTAIVGLLDRGKVWIGADSMGSNGFTKSIRRDPKVFRVGQFLIGFTSSFRMGQLLRYKFSPPIQERSAEDFEYLCTTWIDSFREVMKTGGFCRVEHGVEAGGEFLVGYNRRLYKIYSDFQVGESLDGLAACGSGEDFALGALHTARGGARSRLTAALEAASRFSPFVAPPFVIESI